MSDVFTWPVRVYYEDTDLAGIVYYANYLRFLERARTEWLRALGFEQDRLSCEQGVIFAVVSVDLRYRQPARFNDALRVSVEVSKLLHASVSFRQAVTRDQGDEAVCCHGVVRTACLDSTTMRPRAIPREIVEAVAP